MTGLLAYCVARIEAMLPRRVSRFWRSDWHLSFLLGLLLLVVFVFFPLGGRSLVLRFVLQLFFSLVLISGVALVARSWTARWFAAVFAVGAAAIGWIGVFKPGRSLTVLGLSMWIVFFAMLTAVILLRVFDEGRITLHRIQGAVAAYLLLGVIWAGCYMLVVQFDPEAFNLPAADESTLMSKLIYFSFATLTTVGYGDVTAVDTAARSLAMLEALIGQLFPAVLIARLVSLEVSHREEG
jgi:hypothetical protein